MFAGALVGTTTPAADKGYMSANFIYATKKYAGADHATYHKFKYAAAYT